MHSQPVSSRRRMQDKYLPFVGVAYAEPHGCFTFVARIYRELYGIDLSGLDEGLDQADSRDRTARIQQSLRALAVSVGTPQEGDAVIFRGRPWHIGVVVKPGEMIHSYRGGTSCIERYDSIRWCGRVEGFYRYSP